MKRSSNGIAVSDHIATRRKLQAIAENTAFEDLISRCILTDEEKHILRQHYLQGRSFQSIAFELNFSEDWIKHKHQRILAKLKQLL